MPVDGGLIIAQPALDRSGRRKSVYMHTAIAAPFPESQRHQRKSRSRKAPHGPRMLPSPTGSDSSSIHAFDLADLASIWSDESDLTLHDIALSDSESEYSAFSSHATSSASPSSSRLPSPQSSTPGLAATRPFDHDREPDHVAPEPEFEDPAPEYAYDEREFSPALLAELDDELRADPRAAFAAVCYAACTKVPPTPAPHVQTFPQGQAHRSRSVARRRAPPLQVVPDWRMSRSETDLTFGDALESRRTRAPAEEFGFVRVPSYSISASGVLTLERPLQHAPGYSKPLPSLPPPLPPASPMQSPASPFRSPPPPFSALYSPPPPFTPTAPPGSTFVSFIALEEPAFPTTSPEDTVGFFPVRRHERAKSLGKVGRFISRMKGARPE
ncbi:hypothetical protein BV25DRAFT_1911520 [Artomyces pyxidatus]|uniref:Uncharacterized protein n=1 Tax=Artomyces pyxidatus TaxID=48021 RepID=A0ACB8TGV7_9AGAM|nr:hypothetical protein BV25DRAFT_1911520 [Artomyces pyxidatus]